jgi:cation diffusion facilitator family transporter
MSDNNEAACGGCSCRGDAKRASHDAKYRKALWIVVILNLGFGVIEAIGGFLARSQALKADSLDFLGDGSITLIGLLALNWSGRTRSKVALAQGWFLALLGVGVIAAALMRMLQASLPEADLMGGLGIVGLLVNLAAAASLMKFREGGDANAKAIWLFSRNDAIANIAVIVAAALVHGLKSAWPDLIVAGVIAVLFLHSAWSIISDASHELREKEPHPEPAAL